LKMPVALPADALPRQGGIRVTVKPKLGDELAGVRDYMQGYVYSCLEQKISRAIALGDDARWARAMDDLPAYLDREGLAKYFSADRRGSDTLTAYIVAIADEAGRKLPDDARQRMLGGLRGFVEGKVLRDSALPTADLAIRKVAALEALSRTQPVDPLLLSSISIEPNLWPTSAVIDWYNVVRRSAFAERDKQLSQAEQILRSRLNFQGTTMGFSTERMDYLWWLMISGDVNANRVLLSFFDNDRWREDVPRLVRGTLGRQQHGRWNTTVANAWGVVAMQKFSQAFEHVPVTGTTSAAANGERGLIDWAKNAGGGSVDLAWPSAHSDLVLAHAGDGRPWVTVQSLAAVPLETPLSSGYKVTKSVTSVEARSPGRISRGDTVRVRLEIEAQSDMTWVVVNDPIPAGATILGRGLGGESQILASGEHKRGFVWPAFEERTFEAYRAYYRFVPKGGWVVEYTMRLNNAGRFKLPSTRTEAMYAPEMFGAVPNESMTVDP
ncbi:MAG: alpha-2-macroglobulin, partial [Burkholderiales bacterium]